MAPWTRSNNGRGASATARPVLLAGLGLMLAAPVAGAPQTTETLLFVGLGADPVSRTTDTLRFTGRARGDTP